MTSTPRRDLPTGARARAASSGSDVVCGGEEMNGEDLYRGGGGTGRAASVAGSESSFASFSDVAAAVGNSAAVAGTIARLFTFTGASRSGAVPPGSAQQSTAERMEALRGAANDALSIADEALEEAREAWLGYTRARERFTAAFAAATVIAQDLERKRVVELSDALRKYAIFASSRHANLQYDVQRRSGTVEALASATALTRAAVSSMHSSSAVAGLGSELNDGPRFEDLFYAAGVGAAAGSPSGVGAIATSSSRRSSTASFEGGGDERADLTDAAGVLVGGPHVSLAAAEMGGNSGGGGGGDAWRPGAKLRVRD